MTLVAHEAGVLKPLVHIVRGEIQPVADVFPVRNESRHVVVHGQVGVSIHLAPNKAQIPSPAIVGVPEVCEGEGLRRSYDEEIPHPWIVPNKPVGRPGEEDPVITPSPGEVVLLGRVGEDQPDRPVGIDIENGHEGVFRDPVVEPCRFPPLEDWFVSSVQPDPSLQGIALEFLGISRSFQKTESGS